MRSWARLGVLVGGGLWLGACARARPPLVLAPGLLRTEAGEPVARVALLSATDRLTVGASGLVEIRQEAGEVLWRGEAITPWGVTPGSGTADLELFSPEGRTFPVQGGVRVSALRSDASLVVGGGQYRGALLISRSGAGRLQVVNELPVEQYLLGVLLPELGRRTDRELEALKAQAVAARTYAFRHLLAPFRAGPTQPPSAFDVLPTVEHQLYWGVRGEDPLAARAIQATRSEVLVYQGQVIEAVYHATCGGKTADATTVWGRAFPYLLSRSDKGPRGRLFEATSPHLEWRVEWTGEGLSQILRTTLPGQVSPPPEGVGVLRNLKVKARGPSGRVKTLEVETSAGTFEVQGDRIRSVLRPEVQTPLYSTLFKLKVERKQGLATRVVVEGRGRGHGVGFCQWGALGRAQAGQDYRQILAHYYPHTQLVRLAY